MQGLKEKDYLNGSTRRFDPIAVLISLGLLGAVLSQAIGSDVSLGDGEGSLGLLGDSRSFLFVVGGSGFL